MQFAGCCLVLMTNISQHNIVLGVDHTVVCFSIAELFGSSHSKLTVLLKQW